MGRATDELLAAQGAAVVVVDLPNGRGAEALGGPTTFHPCDITDEKEVEAALDAVLEAHGALHIAVNTAGGASLFATGLLEGAPEDLVKELTKDAAFPRRPGLPVEFAWLAEPIIKNPMLNGQTIRLDGGQRFAPR